MVADSILWCGTCRDGYWNKLRRTLEQAAALEKPYLRGEPMPCEVQEQLVRLLHYADALELYLAGKGPEPQEPGWPGEGC